MTREEFNDNVNDWSSLIEFCYDNDCEVCENVYTLESRNEEIDNNLAEMVAECNGWQDLFYILYDFNKQDGYDYYIRDEYGDFEGASGSDFRQYRQDVLDWMEDNDLWDEEEIEEYDDSVEDNEELTVSEEDDSFSIELFYACNDELQAIDYKEKEAKCKEDEEFTDFFAETLECSTVERVS